MPKKTDPDALAGRLAKKYTVERGRYPSRKEPEQRMILYLKVGPQSFELHYTPTDKGDSDWYRLMLGKALAKIVENEK